MQKAVTLRNLFKLLNTVKIYGAKAPDISLHLLNFLGKRRIFAKLLPVILFHFGEL